MTKWSPQSFLFTPFSHGRLNVPIPGCPGRGRFRVQRCLWGATTYGFPWNGDDQKMHLFATKMGEKTCFDRGIDVCFYCFIVSGHFQKQFQPCTPMNIQILYRFFNSENLSRSTEWTCCHMSSGMLWPCKYPKALLWHVVYEEEIGSVKGHIGPLILGHRDAAVTHSVGKTTRVENLQIRACSADEWSQFETQPHDAWCLLWGTA